ncbi:MAG: YbaB/EbfC family nucleoid-associated protein [Bacteroidetes bacterium]|nr:MAG: YbaB/EbfC family nucleoid-associated protein [Bacteroidota bacterium]
MDLFNIMGKVKEAQERLKVSQEKIGELRTEGESGAGMVKVVINGNRKLMRIEIDDSLMNDKEMVQDLTVAAVNNAIKNMDELIKTEMSKSMEGVLPNIPGLDLSQFLK